LVESVGRTGKVAGADTLVVDQDEKSPLQQERVSSWEDLNKKLQIYSSSLSPSGKRHLFS